MSQKKILSIPDSREVGMSNNFTTMREKQFIDMLSFHKLAKYLNCFSKRVKWGQIDRDAVKRYAEKRLLEIRRKF